MIPLSLQPFVWVVVNLHSCGIGGGGFMVFYQRATKKFIVYDFREVAPAAATEDMYIKNPMRSRYGKFLFIHMRKTTN